MSKIEWTEKTWNPIVGCSVVSPGCTNCYAMKMAARILSMNAGRALDKARGVAAGFIDYGTPQQRDDYLTALRSEPSHYDGTVKWVNGKAVWTGKLALAPEKILLEPLRRKKPTMWFVNSMSDLFHENVPDEWIDLVFAVMAMCPQHTFQVLTKRAERMRSYFERRSADGYDPQDDDFEHAAVEFAILHRMCETAGRFATIGGRPVTHTVPIVPLQNVWLGVSCEDQRRANERIPELLATPAAVRFVSAEPLLSEIDFSVPLRRIGLNVTVNVNGLTGTDGTGQQHARIDWVIVGGESGHDARPMHPDWARAIRDQCAAAGVPFFFKQWGEYVTGYLDRDEFYVDEETHGPNVHWRGTAQCKAVAGESGHYGRVGKKAAGRLLDGREWSDMPVAHALRTNGFDLPPEVAP